MPLQHRASRSCRRCRLSRVRLQPDEFDVGAERREVHRKRGRGLLPPQRRFEHGVAAVDANAVAGHVGGREERQAHDVVPVHMGHEDVIGLRRRRRDARCAALAERSHAAAEVAQDVIRTAGLDLDAGLNVRRKVPATCDRRLST